MMQKITVSAPAKIHLLGEHVVVYNKPALLTVVDKRCAVSIIPKSGNTIVISTNLSHEKRSVTFEEIISKTKKARESWTSYNNSKDVSILSSIVRDVFDYIEIAIGETFLYYKSSYPGGFSLHIESEIPVGSGMGSSAALAVSVSGAIALFIGKAINNDDIFSISYEIEKRRHGLPSGGDPAAVLYGGIIWFEKGKPRNIQQVGNRLSQNFSGSFLIVNSGVPFESTGEMIDLVSKYRKLNPSHADELFDSQEQLTVRVKHAFEEEDTETLRRSLTQAQRNLEELGVVSDETRELIAEIEKHGGAAKISGAGGKKKGSGIIIVHTTDKKKLKDMFTRYSLDYYDVKIGVGGLSVS